MARPSPHTPGIEHPAKLSSNLRGAVPVAAASSQTAHLGATSGDADSWRLWPLALVLTSGLVLRLSVWLILWNQPLAIWDERDYNVLALGITQRGEFGFEPGALTSLRPPLYPALMAGTYALFGQENYQAVRFLQCLVSMATAVVIYRLGAAIFSPRVGFWATILFSVYPSFIVYSNLLLTETVFTFFLCATCYALYLGLQSSSVRLMFLAGVLLGLAALTRSVMWLFPILLIGYVLWAWREGIARRLLAIGSLTLAFSLVLAPWTLRNSLLQQTFVTVDVMGGRNFMMGNYRYTPLYRAWDAIGIQGEQSWDHEVRTTTSPEERSTQGKVDKLALRRGLAFIWENPGLTFQRDLIKWLNFWGLEREIVAGASRGNFGVLPRPVLLALTVAIIGNYACAMLLGLYGIVLAPPLDRRAHVLLLLVTLFVCGMHVLVFAHSRYHLPLMPLIFLYSASALVQARAIWQRRRTISFAIATSLCCLFIAGWAWEACAMDRDRYIAVWEAMLGP